MTHSRLDRTARLFAQHRGRWISALTLARHGGLCGFRGRISECRRLLGMQIENRTDQKADGAKHSFYRYTGRIA